MSEDFVEPYEPTEAEELEYYRKALAEAKQQAEDAIESAWGLIANAGGGNWEMESDEWREAAKLWRDTHVITHASTQFGDPNDKYAGGTCT